MAVSQVTINTPLGPDELMIATMDGTEQLGRLFQFDLELYSKNPEINIDDILARDVTVKLVLANNETRYFNGVVSRFSQSGVETEGTYHSYQATLRPWLWFLTRAADCRIFQEQSVPDIIKQVFRDSGFSDFEVKLDATYRTWEYCVQYRETDFNFVSRLMEQEGIYYYFQHKDGKHTLTLCDSYSAHSVISGKADLPYYPGGGGQGQMEHIFDWQISREVQPGAYALNDYDFKRPKASLRVSRPIKRKHAEADHEIYDYPGEYVESSDGEQYALARIEEQHVQFEQVSAGSNARAIATGQLFTLTNYPREDQNREYLVTASSYSLSSGTDIPGAGAEDGPIYTCSFSAIESRTPFRSARLTPKPVVQGLQSAIVVGPSGEEVYPDEFGRVKVQFYWDRYGKGDENSSCWVRVAQLWAGKGWGAQYMPRIGQEVLVSFHEGDPDRPIVSGRVYNADNMPPYKLPDSKTQSGIKSRSTKEGTDENFNELRFEDKKGEEQLIIHAEKDQEISVENDEAHSVGHDRTKDVGNDETTSIGKNRSENVGENETVSIGSNQSLSVGKNRDKSVGENESNSVGADQTVSIGANRTKDVAKDETNSIGSNQTSSIGKDARLDVGAERQTSIGKDDKLSVGKKLLIDAGDEIVLNTGSASISMKKNGEIVIKGKDITLKGSGKINIKASSDVTIKGSKIKQN